MATLLSYALTSVADVKELLGIDSGDSTKDNLIIRKINQATTLIENYCQRRFASTVYTDVEYDSPDSDTLVLSQRPVTSFTSLGVRDGPENLSSWSTVETQDYFVDTAAGILKLNFNTYGAWNRYRVTYTAGYTTIPADLGEAAATLAAYLVDNGVSGTGVKRKKEGQREIEYFESGPSNTGGSLLESLGLDDILEPYRNYNLG